jgi:nucleoside-triphosphatase THEP1
MRITYTMMPGRGDMDRLLCALADELANDGYRVSGVVQSNEERPGDHPCDMDIKVLPDGPEFRISQALGKGSRGCRLDPSALEQAALGVERSLDGGADLLLINKFGKNEAQGRGLTDAIVKAVEMDIPILCGLNDLNLPAFEAFTDNESTRLDPKIDDMKHWVYQSLRLNRIQSA